MPVLCAGREKGLFSAGRDAGQWLGAAREAGQAEQLGPHASGVTWELKGRGESLTSGWGVLVRAGDWGAVQSRAWAPSGL